MEKREDKVLSEILNSMDELPDNYHPDLNAKWELLNNALSPDRKKQKRFVWMKWSVAALLLLSVGGFIYIEWKDAGNGQKQVVHNPSQNHSIAPVFIQEKVKTTKISEENNNHLKKRKTIIKTHPVEVANITAPVVNKDTLLVILHESIAEDTAQYIIEEGKKADKKQRYISVDFGEDGSAKSIVNSTLKLNILKSYRTEEANSLKSGNALMFQKSF